MLLKHWILPLVVFPAKVVLPTEQVVSMLATVYNVALKITSWDVTPDILALPPHEGGHSLPQPNTFL